MSEMALPSIDWRVVFNRATPPGRRHWGRVRAAQLKELGPAMTVAAIGQAFNALFVVTMMAGKAPIGYLAGWVAAIAALTGFTFLKQRELSRRHIIVAGRSTVDRTALIGIMFGILWQVPARLFWEYGSHSQQLALAVMTAVTMAGAAFIFAPVPAAALGFIALMTPAIGYMLWTSETPGLANLAVVYGFAMIGFVYVTCRAFMQRTWLDIELEERRKTVSMLLREYENSDADWLWKTNAGLSFEAVSSRFARAFGRSAEDIARSTIRDLLTDAPRTDQGVRRAMAAGLAALSKREPITDLLVPVEVEGEIRTIQLSAQPRFSSQGRFRGYEGVGSDVTESHQAQMRIAHLARHDVLTGLPNRLSLLDNLDAALKTAASGGDRCAVILVDLNRFKSINDTLGHVAGDALLKQVAHCLESVISDDMTAGRLGGDEFAIVVPVVESRHELEQLCLAMVGALHGPFHYEDQRLVVGSSLGVAMGPRDGDTVEELMRNADLALYKAKAGSGDAICFYDISLQEQNEERRNIEFALRKAVGTDEFRLNYQPLVNAKTGRIESFEALLRWTSKELGAVSPARFIPIAEETGMLGKIGEWVLRTACQEAAAWPDDVSVAVNVSPRQLQDPGFLVTLMSALTQARLPARRLELEVTESVFLELTERTQQVLQQIQSLGVRLAMDDFGTGYSSLGYLRRAEFDTLKIDQSFVQSMREDDPESTAIVRAVVALAGSLGLRTVAEGVQTEEQLRMVRDLGCDKIQGFIFSPAVDPAKARTMLGQGIRSAAA